MGGWTLSRGGDAKLERNKRRDTLGLSANSSDRYTKTLSHTPFAGARGRERMAYPEEEPLIGPAPSASALSIDPP